MSERLKYAQWLVDHEQDSSSADESVKEKFNTVKEAYRLSGGGESIKENTIQPSNVPIFNTARESGFLKGYMDQAAGIAQMVERFRTPTTAEYQLKEAGIKKPTVDEFIAREEAAYQNKRQEDGDTGVDWARMAGNIANPISVGTAQTIVPKVGASILKKVALGSAAGGVALGTHPVNGNPENFGREKASQIAVGATVGGAIPVAVIPLRGAYDLVKYLARPFSEAGQLADLKKMYLALAGESREKIVQSLEAATTHVKGNKPTSGQAIAEGTTVLGADGLPVNFGGGIVKMEQELSKKVATGDALKTIYGQQAARRSDAINNLIDSGEDALTTAINARTMATKPYYDIVENSTKKVDVAPVLNILKKLRIINKNEKSITTPVAEIEQALLPNGAVETSPQALHSLSKHISNLMSKKTPGGTNEFDVKALNDIKKALDAQIERAEPAYKMARKLHADYSVPVNQINVTRELGGALENAVKEESPRQFLNAIDNAAKTLKKSTGFPRYQKLDDVLNPQQMKTVGEVKNELIRQAKERNMAAKTESVLKAMKGEIEPSLPNMLSRPMMLANAVLKRIGTEMSPKYEALAIKITQDPSALAKLLKLPQDNPQRQMAVELMSRFSAMVPSQGIAPEVEREF